MSIELKVGEWYEDGNGLREFVIADTRLVKGARDVSGQPIIAIDIHGVINSYSPGGVYAPDGKSSVLRNLIRHLPGCTGFDWVEPAPKKWRPAVITDLLPGIPVPCRVRNNEREEWQDRVLMAISVDPKEKQPYRTNGKWEYRFCEVEDTGTADKGAATDE